jgi:hypothetical protein
VSSKYQKLIAKLERLPVDHRFQIVADLWPRLSAALQVAILGMMYAILGEIGNHDTLLDSLVEVSFNALYPGKNEETPETSNPVIE